MVARSLPWVLVAAFCSVSANAFADDVCLTAPVDGQKLQRAGKLLRARERFTQCARNSCPGAIVQDCTQWEQTVDRAVPSVVVAARDGQGSDMPDAQVSVDGQAPAAVTARAIELDPGMHHFVVSRAGAASVSIDAMLVEGEKNRELRAVLGAASPAAPVSPEPSADVEPGRSLPTGTWIAGGVGVVALGVFGVFGTMGVIRRGDDGCATGCSSGEKSGVDADLRVADIALATGLVASAVAAGFYLLRPAAARASTTALFDVQPSRGAAVGTIGLRF